MFNWLKKKFTPVPKTTYYIVAGDRRQADFWAQYMLDPDKHIYRYVNSAESLRGVSIAPNQVLYVGTFYLRTDIAAIADAAALSTRLPMP